jgi:hypothetical protein
LGETHQLIEDIRERIGSLPGRYRQGLARARGLDQLSHLGYPIGSRASSEMSSRNDTPRL